ncbi:MAG: tetraacyldisaccharide 4'-kinase [Methylotenera sp.]|nr:tetraacyldisaccharide 4'-kinase [Methylotenera sp.]
MGNWLQKQWLQYTAWHILLLPLSWFFGFVTFVRRLLYRAGWLKSFRLSVPVIVVGNINVGGTGKTPLVIWLVEQLKSEGFNPGIISRGYGGANKKFAEVFANSNPAEVGDEPVLIAKRTNSPMFVGADRVTAGQALLKAHPECNVIVSDDGLQHYRLKRDFEIALVNSNLRFGNQLLLPAGPLREKVAKLQSVDAIVDSGSADDFGLSLKDGMQSPVFNMQLQGDAFESLGGVEIKQYPSYFSDKSIVAIAGIGNPERFFSQLSAMGLRFERKAFTDHHAFTKQDLAQFADKTILMTEKDAVKCQLFTTVDAWYLPVTAVLGKSTERSLITLIMQKLRI